jgi:hypothetical protein
MGSLFCFAMMEWTFSLSFPRLDPRSRWRVRVKAVEANVAAPGPANVAAPGPAEEANQDGSRALYAGECRCRPLARGPATAGHGIRFGGPGWVRP